LPDGGDIVLTQREAVNDAWDLPKTDTMTPFLERHPDWTDYAQIETPFEWKWYYAFQQVGDQRAETLSQAYRSGRQQRDALIGKASFISPASLLQRQLEKLARTDMRSSLAYEQDGRDFHANLRAWYYPRLFPELPFDAEAAKRELPVYSKPE